MSWRLRLEASDPELQMQQKELYVSQDKMEKTKEEDYPLILICYVKDYYLILN